MNDWNALNGGLFCRSISYHIIFQDSRESLSHRSWKIQGMKSAAKMKNAHKEDIDRLIDRSHGRIHFNIQEMYDDARRNEWFWHTSSRDALLPS